MPEGARNGLPDIPEIADDYELVRELGRGGTAVVYLARDRELGRDVAIKLIRPSYVQDEEALARLVREARTVGKLQHPNIVMLLGTRRLADGGLALILQYVPGRSLKERIREEGPLPIADVESILGDLGRALSHAHRSRIVHRDIKPENVYLDESVGVARLADFGIARAWDSDSGLTLPGTALGTPSYMSPEQVDGRDLDGRSDLYGLGLLGWEMLTGRQPWEGEGLYAVISKQKNEDLPRVRSFRDDVPEHLEGALEGATRKDPDERWRSVDRFLEVLGQGTRVSDASKGPKPVATPWSQGFEEADSGRPSPLDLRPRPAPAEAVPDPPDGYDRSTGLSEPPASPASRPGKLRIAVAALAFVVIVGGAVILTEPDGTLREAVLSALPGGGGPADEGEFFDDSRFLRPQGDDPDLDPIEQAEAGGDPESASGPGSVAALGSALDTLGPGALGGDSIGPGEGTFQPLEGGGVLQVLQGDEQSGAPGAQLPDPLVVLLLDEGGSEVSGADLEYQVVAGGGSVDPALDQTRPDGSSLARWTLGNDGDQRLEVRIADTGEVAAVFRADLREVVPGSLQALSAGSVEGPPGETLEDPLEVRVLDAQGAPMAGVAVRFEVEAGGGSVQPVRAVTDPQGVAQASWTLGAIGAQQLRTFIEASPDIGTEFGASAIVPSLPVRAGIRVGGSQTCMVGGDGSMACWGANDRGQLGNGGGGRRGTPGVTLGAGSVADLAVGVNHACALSPSGDALCWGANDQGQLGLGGGDRDTPTTVNGPAPFTRIAAGLGHTCAITRDGSAYCWGRNANGELGAGGGSGGPEPRRVDGGPFVELAAGWRHTCARAADGQAFCWGAGEAGQLGHGGRAGVASPRLVAGGYSFEQIAAGNAHTCGLAANGTVVCWGDNAMGQLGTGASGSGTPTAAPVDSDERFVDLAAGGVHTCAVTQGGSALCWGRNNFGQLGDGSTTDRAAPVTVVGNYRFSELSALGSHTCGRNPAGELYCWGYNVEGQLGDGTRQNRSEPVRVVGY